jgi:hypothetical protein
MKELVKPISFEQKYEIMELFDEGPCNCRFNCNKVCSDRGTTNSSSNLEDDIIF